MAIDTTGTLYLPGKDQIVKVSVAGIVSTMALPPKPDNFQISCLGVDSAGSVYFGYGSSQPSPLQKVTTGGVVSTVDATPVICRSLAFDAAGNLYIATEYGPSVLRKDAISGALATVAGNGSYVGNPVPGPATATPIGIPYGVIADGGGGILIANGSQVMRVDAGGTLSIVAGAVGSPPSVLPASEGSVAANSVFYINGQIARDAAGNLYIPSFFANQVFRVDTSGIVHVAAGAGPGGPTVAFAGDGGPAAAARLAAPRSIVRDAAGNSYIADSSNRRIRKVDAAGTITSLPVGDAQGNGDGGPATSATLVMPQNVAIANDGRLAITAGLSAPVRMVSAGGTLSTGAPLGLPRFDGVVFDLAGNLYVASESRVYRVDAAGNASVFAGGASGGFSGDGGPATSALLGNPRTLAIDAAGNLYIADYLNTRVRKVAPNGVITTVAGNGTHTFVDGAPATGTGIRPDALAVDGAGNLYVGVDAHALSGIVPFFGTDAHRIIKVDASGIARSIAGTGTAGASGEGVPAASSSISQPLGLAADDQGNLYFSETNLHRIRVISPDGLMRTFAGTGTAGFGGDAGPAIDAKLASPVGLAWDPAGAILVADSGNGRVRRILAVDTTPNTFTIPAATGVATSAVIQSAAVTPAGFAAAATVTVVGGEYSIGCSGTFTSAAGTLAPGQSVCVRHTSSATHNVDTVTLLRVGGVEATFRSTTVAGPGSISLSSASIDFGGQSINTSSPARTVTVTNSGAVGVTIHSAAASAGFNATHACGALAASATCTITAVFTPASQGSVNGTLTIRATSGDYSVTLAGTGERSLITHYYQSILGRAPEAGGRVFWEGESTRFAGLGANANETVFAMAAQFFASAEYVALNRDNAGFLADLYRTFFNRGPDPSGSSYWMGQMASGMPREVVMVYFMFSPEFTTFSQALFGTPTSRPEVDMVMDFYRGLLARLPDTAGFNAWLARFRTAQCTGAAAVRNEVNAITSEFIASPEYTGRNRTNAQFVGDMYNAILRRGGDPTSVQQWITLLTNGTYTRDVVRGGFTQSAEFQQRVNRVIAAGCQP